MKIFTASQIQKIDQYTIQHEPIASIDLMERAAERITGWLEEKYLSDQEFLVFAGEGNNGGDALAVARMLLLKGYAVTTYQLCLSGKASEDCTKNKNLLKNIVPGKFHEIKSAKEVPFIGKECIVLDGLFGSGMNRPLKGLAGNLVRAINNSGAECVAIDMPSGLFCEDNTDNIDAHIVKATHTLSLQFYKLAFMFNENENKVGEIHLIDIGLDKTVIKETQTPYHLLSAGMMPKLLRPRRKFAHKGHYGHALLIAGSYGKTGAAVLAAEACLRTGAGLLTAYLPTSSYQIMQTSLPECMVETDVHDKYLAQLPGLDEYDTVGIGPGIGQNGETVKLVRQLLKSAKQPLVIDADALNIIGKEGLQRDIPLNSILTPHPKEFERLTGEKYRTHYERVQAQIQFSAQYRIIVVLKGAHTSITTPGGTCYFNSTGNPGMATAGSGDVLTGMLLGLLSQAYDLESAALLGVYLHGFSGDLAARKKTCYSLIASDIISKLPKAFRKL